MGRIKRTSKRATKVYGTTARPRLAVKKSIRHIIAQLINDDTGTTLAFACSKKGDKNNIETAKRVGTELASKAKTAGVTSVVFDRREYIYHGKVKALADAARSSGLQF